MYKVVILTADSLRHKYFFSKFLKSEKINVLKCFSETTSAAKNKEYVDLENIKAVHFNERARVEYDFFYEYVNQNFSNEKIVKLNRGEINSVSFEKDLSILNPDFVVCYGCSILSPKLIETFRGKILNVHLGLSPYYLGSGTNFHPLVDDLPELVGFTLMHIDEGVDTGEIIHQKRPRINVYDNSHHVGCKIIQEMTNDYIRLISEYDKVVEKVQPSFSNSKICYRKDSTTTSIEKMYANIKSGMFHRYLKNKKARDGMYPIIQQEFLI